MFPGLTQAQDVPPPASPPKATSVGPTVVPKAITVTNRSSTAARLRVFIEVPYPSLRQKFARFRFDDWRAQRFAAHDFQIAPGCAVIHDANQRLQSFHKSEELLRKLRIIGKCL